MIMKYY